jgi:hypothetical protein
MRGTITCGQLAIVLLCGCKPQTVSPAQTLAQREAEATQVLREVEMPSITDAKDPAFAAIYIDTMAAIGQPPMRLVCAFWNDGRVVWNSNPAPGQTTHLRGKLSQDQLEQFRAALGKQIAGIELADRWKGNFGPDSVYTVVTVCDGPARLWYASWHEVEDGAGVAVTERGVEVLEGRDKAKVMAAVAPEYRAFLNRWDLIKSTMLRALPDKGEPCTNNFELVKKK